MPEHARERGNAHGRKRERGPALRSAAPGFFSAVRLTSAPFTPGMDFTARSAAWRKGLQFVGALGRNGDGEINLGVRNEDIGHHAEFDDVAVEIRAADGLQGFQNLISGEFGHAILSKLS